MTLQNYEWQVDGRPDGKLRKVGEPIKMTDAEAKYHLQMGNLKRLKAPSKPVQKPTKATGNPAEDAKPKGDAASSSAPSKETTAK